MPDDATSTQGRLGPYDLRRQLGAGGMGTVHLATVRAPVGELSAGQQVALKLIHPHLLGSPGFFERFMREAEVGMRIEHENVVRTYDCEAITSGDTPQHLLVMEYVEGQTLLDLIDELGQVPDTLCRHIAREVARALVAIHAHDVIHRDLKPENVLITQDHVVKIMDLGIAFLIDEATRLSQTGQFLGTLAYAAPEQLGGREGIDGRADLYATGAMLYQLLSGRLPLRASGAAQMIRVVLEQEPQRLSQHAEHISPFMEEVVHTLLAKVPAKRFPDAATLLAVLEEGEQSAWWQARERARAEAPSRPRVRLDVPRETELHGREEELASLRAWFDLASDGMGRVVLLEGEQGIGKTRLVDAFAEQVWEEQPEIPFLFGTHRAGRTSSAWSAFGTAFREHLGPTDLSATLATHLDGEDALADTLASVIADQPGAEAAESLSADVVETLFIRVAQSLAARTPLIVFIDDLHAGPDAGRELFLSLARAAAEWPILLVGTIRSGACPDWVAAATDLDTCEHVLLRRLGAKDLMSLLQDTFQSEDLTGDLGMQIAVKSDGNPYFVLEIIRNLRETGVISQRPNGAWTAMRTIERIEIPDSILTLVASRLKTLSDDERDLLDVAACMGTRFDPAVLAAVRGEQRMQILKQCARLERMHGLLRAAGRSYAFDQQPVRDAVYEALHEQMREGWHGEIAEALAARAESNTPDGAEAAELCEHAVAGGRPLLAQPYAMQAIKHLAAAYDHARADRLAMAMLEVPALFEGSERLALLIERAELVGFQGRNSEEVAMLDEAIALAREERDGRALSACLTKQGYAWLRMGQYDQARRLLQKGQATAHRVGAMDLHIDAALYLGRIEEMAGDFAKARKLFDACLGIATELGDGRRELQSLLHVTSIAMSQGRDAEVQVNAERTLALALEQGDRARECGARTLLGISQQGRGDYEDAAENYQAVLRAARTTGNRQRELQARTNMGNLLSYRGHLGEALEMYRPMLQLARALGVPRSEAIGLVNMAGMLLRLGDLGNAAAAGERCLSMARELGQRRVEGYALHTLGTIASAMDRPDEAERHLQEALALRRETWYVSGIASTLALQGQLHLQESPDTARKELEEAAELARSLASPGVTIATRCALARIGVVEFEEAAALLASDGGRIPLDEQRRAHMTLWEGGGERTHLESAHTLLQYELLHAPTEHHEAMVSSVPINRRIVRAWAGLPS